MCHANLWNQIVIHLTAAGLWKHVHVITMGDMCQLPPPNRYKPLYVDFVLKARKPQVFAEKQTCLSGITNFETFRKLELTTQNRAKDPEHCRRNDQLRNGEIDDNIINSLKPLTSEDTKNGWEFVPILVTSNCERIALNRLQVIAYAKKYGLHVLRWVNPVRNCKNKTYSVDTIEAILPAAVQYFVVGAPANIVQNHNPVSTNIVNGTRVIMHSLIWSEYEWAPPAHSTPGQVHDVPRPDYVVVIRDTDTGEKDDNDDGELIPLKLVYDQETVQGVDVRYKAFPYDLGFAITFHKVQGQTMRRIIMFLHERKSNKLAKLMWESFYVAHTRVKRGDDMRVCYHGSDVVKPSTAGLQHLKKLRRPKLYDEWQRSYDKNGYWKDTKLKADAAKARNHLLDKLSRVTLLSRTSLIKLKQWADILDVSVQYKPNTLRKNKEQYLEAITPIWLRCTGKRSEPQKGGKSKMRETTTVTMPSKRKRPRSNRESLGGNL